MSAATPYPLAGLPEEQRQAILDVLAAAARAGCTVTVSDPLLAGVLLGHFPMPGRGFPVMELGGGDRLRFATALGERYIVNDDGSGNPPVAVRPRDTVIGVELRARTSSVASNPWAVPAARVMDRTPPGRFSTLDIGPGLTLQTWDEPGYRTLVQGILDEAELPWGSPLPNPIRALYAQVPGVEAGAPFPLPSATALGPMVPPTAEPPFDFLTRDEWKLLLMVCNAGTDPVMVTDPAFAGQIFGKSGTHLRQLGWCPTVSVTAPLESVRKQADRIGVYYDHHPSGGGRHGTRIRLFTGNRRRLVTRTAELYVDHREFDPTMNCVVDGGCDLTVRTWPLTALHQAMQHRLASAGLPWSPLPHWIPGSWEDTRYHREFLGRPLPRGVDGGESSAAGAPVGAPKPDGVEMADQEPRRPRALHLRRPLGVRSRADVVRPGPLFAAPTTLSGDGPIQPFVVFHVDLGGHRTLAAAGAMDVTTDQFLIYLSASPGVALMEKNAQRGDRPAATTGPVPPWRRLHEALRRQFGASVAIHLPPTGAGDLAATAADTYQRNAVGSAPGTPATWNVETARFHDIYWHGRRRRRSSPLLLGQECTVRDSVGSLRAVIHADSRGIFDFGYDPSDQFVATAVRTLARSIQSTTTGGKSITYHWMRQQFTRAFGRKWQLGPPQVCSLPARERFKDIARYDPKELRLRVARITRTVLRSL